MFFSVFEYQYRDASGYKVSGKLLIKGGISKNNLKAYLYDAEFFVPEEVGIPPLQSILWDEFGGPCNDDHDWHTIEDIRKAEDEDMNLPVWGTKEELKHRFQQNRERCKNTTMDMFF